MQSTICQLGVETGSSMIRSFGEFELDDRSRKLCRGGQTVKLTGQALDLLTLLVERPGQLVARDEIKRQLWPDSKLELEHSLDVLMNRLRSILGDSGASPRYIETVPRRGYRFLGPVRCEPDRTHRTAKPTVIRRLASYAAIALLAAAATLLIVHSRYDKFVPSRRAPMRPAQQTR